MPDNKLQTLHGNLTKTIPGFNVPLSQFETNMKDEAKLKALHTNLSGKVKDFTVPFEQFKSDMFPDVQDTVDYGPFDKETVEKYPQSRQNFERWQGENSKVETPQKKKGFWDTYMGDTVEKFGAGTSYLGEMVPRIMNMPYKVMANIEAKKMGLDPVMREAYVEAFMSSNPQTFANEALADELQKVRESLSKKADRYEGKDFSELWKDGDKTGAIGQIFLEATQSLPISIAAGVTGGAGLAAIGAGSAALKYDELGKSEKPSGKPNSKEWEDYTSRMDMSEAAKITNAILSGASEAGSEYLGSVPIMGWLGRLYSKGGKQAVQGTVKKGIKETVDGLLDKYGLLTAPIIEGTEEYANQVAQNVTDYITGARTDFKPFENAGKSFVYGAGGGAQFSIAAAPGVIAGKLSGSKDQPQIPQIPQPTPQQTREAQFAEARNKAAEMVQFNYDRLKHTDGNLHTGFDSQGNEYIVLSETPGGMAIVHDANGEKKPIPLSDIKDRKVQAFDEFTAEQMGIFDQENSAMLQPKEQSTFKMNGKMYSIQDVTTDGKWIASELDVEGSPSGQVIEVEKEYQDKMLSQLQNNPEVSPELNAIEVGGKMYSFTPANDGTMVGDVYTSMQEAEKAKADIETVLGAKDDITILSKPNPDPMQPDQFTIAVKPKADLLQTEGENLQFESLLPDGDKGLSPEMESELQKETEPSYSFKGQPIDKKKAMSIINIAADLKNKDKLAGLQYANDPELDELVEKHFPKPVAAFKIGNKKYDEESATTYIEMADTKEELDRLKIENIEVAPEVQKVYEAKMAEFGKVEKANKEKENTEHNKLVRLMQDYNTKSDYQRKQTNTSPIVTLASQLGYNTKTDAQGKLIVVDKGTEIKMRSGRINTDEEIQSHKSVQDYLPEVQETMNRFMLPFEVEGVEIGTLAPKEVKQAILDIQAGKKTVASNSFLDEIEKIHNGGVIRLKSDRRSGMPGVDVTLTEYFNVINEDLTDSENDIAYSIPENVADAINNNSPTYEELDSYEKLIPIDYGIEQKTTDTGTSESVPESTESRPDEKAGSEVQQEVEIEKNVNIISEKEKKFTKTETQSIDTELEKIFTTEESLQKEKLENEKPEKSLLKTQKNIELGLTTEQPAAISKTVAPVVEKVEQEAAKVNTNPTEAQIKAGNYQKGHISIQGMDITIENPKGSTRSGTDEDGKAWETKMKNHYGYFKRSKGKDGDQIDVFVGENPESEKVFVVDQVNPKTGKFDESKVMLGFNDVEQAREAYLSNYQPGWKGLGSITEVEVAPFKEWLKDGKRQYKAYSEYKDTPEPVIEERVPEAGETKRPEIGDDVTFSYLDGSDIIGQIMSKEGNVFRIKGQDGKVYRVKEGDVSMAEGEIRERKLTPAGYYSTVENALEKIQQEKGTPEQFKAMLLKNGAKEAELIWMGFDEFSQDKKSLTKADVQNWIDQNRIEVEEVELTDQTRNDLTVESIDINYSGSGQWQVKFKELDDTVDFPLEKADDKQEAESYAKEIASYDSQEKINQKPKYFQYQLPGGENYKEVLLTMSEQRPIQTSSELEEQSQSDYRKPYSELSEIQKSEIKKQVMANKGYTKDYSPKTFKSSHFDEPNILAHIRFNERTDSEGNKVLFIEEIQSDWAQKGKKEGFLNETAYQIAQSIYYTNKKLGQGILSKEQAQANFTQLKEEATAKNISEQEIQSNLDKYGDFTRKQEGVPNTPFAKTDQWVNLAFRRMMKYAAENGFDRIAWTNGEMQAARYNLSKVVDKITIVKDNISDAINKKGEQAQGYIVNAVKGEENVINNETMPIDKIEETLGKEIAKGVIEGKEIFEGEGLEVGGKGMKAFYDAIVPSAASKLGKPFNSKVESVKIQQVGSVQSIFVTPEMIQSVSAGVPLFKPKTALLARQDSKQNIVDKLNEIQSSAKNARPVYLFSNQAELESAAEKAGAGKNTKASILKSSKDAMAFYDPITKAVYINTSKINNIEEAVSVWLHEMGIHAGLENIIPETEFNGLMEAVHDFVKTEAETNPYYKALFDEVTVQYSESNKAIQGEEMLAWIAERAGEGTLAPENKALWKRLVDYIKDMLKRIYGAKNIVLTERDVMNIVNASIRSNLEGEINQNIKTREKLKQKEFPLLSKRDPSISTKPNDMPKKGDKIKVSENAEYNGQDMDWTEPFTGYKTIGKGGEWVTHNSSKIIKSFVPKQIAVHPREYSEGYFESNASLEDINKSGYSWDNYIYSIFLPEGTVVETFGYDEYRIEIGNNTEIIFSGTIREAKGPQKKNNQTNRFVDTYIKYSDTIDPSQPNTILINGVERPTTNSNGKPIAATEEGIRNFWEWFGESKVVDKNGRPLVVYHGTDKTFNKINMRKGAQGLFWVTSDKSAIEAGEVGASGKGKIMELYTKIENPADWDQYEKLMLFQFESRGLDGAILPDPDGSFVAFVLNTNQIKSATGNIGTFSPKSNDIRFKKGEPATEILTTDELTGKKQIISKGERIRQLLQDKELALKNWLNDVRSTGITIRDFENPYQQENLSHGRILDKMNRFTKNEGKSLIESVSKFIKAAGIDVKEASNYMIAKHGPERNKWFWEQDVKNLDKDFSGLTELRQKVSDQLIKEGNTTDGNSILLMPVNDFAKWYTDKIEAKAGTELTEKLWDTVNKATDFTLTEWKNGGFISNEQYEALKERYKNYIPLRGWEHTGEEFDYAQSVGQYSNPIKKAEGRRSVSDDPLAYIMNMANSAVISSERNKIKQYAGNLVRNNIEALKPLVTFNKTYFVKTGDKDSDGNDIIYETIDRPAQELFDLNRVTIKTPSAYKSRKTSGQAKEFEVEYYENGQKMVLVFEGSDPAVARALNNTEVSAAMDSMNKAINAAIKIPGVGQISVGKATRYLSSVLTSLNPAFAIPNMMRDIPLAMISEWVGGSGMDAATMLPNMKLAEGAVRRSLQGNSSETNEIDQKYQDFLKNGGATGFVHLKSVDNFKKELLRDIKNANSGNNAAVIMGKGFRTGLKYIEQLSEWSENITRFAVYLNHINRGETPQKAAFAAKNSTVNFNKKGRLTPTLNGLFAFFNAAIQASDKYFNMWGKNWGKMAAVHSVLMVQGFISAMLLDLFGGEDDDEIKRYDKVSGFIMKNYMVIPIPYTDRIVSIPMPHVLRAFHGLGVDAYNLVSGRKDAENVLTEAFSGIPSDIIPVDVGGILTREGDLSVKPFTPTVMKPFVELMLNENFMGRPIYPEAFTLQQKALIADTRRSRKNVNKMAQSFTDFLYKAGGGDESGYRYIYKDGETKKIPVLLDINPHTIEYLFESYFGGTGKFFNDLYKTSSGVLDVSKSIAQGNEFEKAIKEIDVNMVPVINRFIRQSWGDPVKTKFYEVKTDIERKIEIMKDAKKRQDWEKFDEIQKEVGVQIELYKSYDKQIEKLDEAYYLMMKKNDEKEAKLIEEERRDVMKNVVKLENKK